MNLEDIKVASQAYALEHFTDAEHLNKIKDAWINGFETATQWIKIEEQTPEYNKPVLLKYLKGGKEVITQGYFRDEALEIAKRQLKAAEERGHFSENGIETADFWRRNGRGEIYFDYADRQIQKLTAKSKNKVMEWREII